MKANPKYGLMGLNISEWNFIGRGETPLLKHFWTNIKSKSRKGKYAPISFSNYVIFKLLTIAVILIRM
jgi:hypothetical protein